jgi:hypothetical protein
MRITLKTFFLQVFRKSSGPMLQKNLHWAFEESVLAQWILNQT